MLIQDRCRRCKTPVGDPYRYDPLAFDEDDGWVLCPPCENLEEQARREYVASLSWLERAQRWCREKLC
jgi:uncharacterized Zn finger protein (UPF0148 family)